MSEKIQNSDVFKFVALRPPVSIDKKNQAKNFIVDNREAEKTSIGEIVTKFENKEGVKILEQISKFAEENKYDISFPEDNGNFLLSKTHEFVSNIKKEEFTVDLLTKGISKTLNNQIGSFLENENSRNLLNESWDRYYAFYMLSRVGNQNLENLSNNLRIFHLLKFISNSEISNYQEFTKIISATPIVSSLFADIYTQKAKISAPRVEKTDPKIIESYRNIWNELILTYQTINEINNIKFETKIEYESKDIIIPNKETGIEEKSKLTFAKSSLSINEKSFEKLNENTKQTLNSYDIGTSNFNLNEPIVNLQNKFQNLYNDASSINDIEFFKLMPKEAKAINGISSVISKFDFDMFNVPFIPQRPNNVRALIKPLGIGDLKVVKQKLKKYSAGEVAHIENVLRGEYKERKHRVLDRTEDFFAITTENNEETTKDTQTTERFELKKESEKTIQEQMSVQAGVTVTGSYGMVTFGAQGNFAYSTASQESNKNSSNFAREVIDKSISKIQKKTKEERSTKKLHEVEEINTHGVDNKDKPDHAVGIYRWVDKLYEAQIYNYGKRMMFEFIIPEPATFFEFAQTHKPKKDIIAPKPFPANFTHKDIKDYNYSQFVRDYNVQGITTPPLAFKTISTSMAKDGLLLDGVPHGATTKELIIPEGYYSRNEVLFNFSGYHSIYPKVEIMIGNRVFKLADSGGRLNNPHNGVTIAHSIYTAGNSIQISINLYDVSSFAMNAYVLVERTSEHYEQWQIQTFEKILNAYKAMQMEYEQKLASQEVMQGIAITGQNPRINREIEKTELKKQCIKMLMDSQPSFPFFGINGKTFGGFDAMGNDGKDGKGLKLLDKTFLPDFENYDAVEEGKAIQFFEQAFEWENLTYLFYPYFWARKEQWVHKSTMYDNDPLFTKFLQAGSARVVLPVHPGYNDAIMYFLENNGEIWNGGPPSRLNDPLFISLADELKDQTDDLANAVKEGEPWDIILPTTLVYLQKDSELPTFNN